MPSVIRHWHHATPRARLLLLILLVFLVIVILPSERTKSQQWPAKSLSRAITPVRTSSSKSSSGSMKSSYGSSAFWPGIAWIPVSHELTQTSANHRHCPHSIFTQFCEFKHSPACPSGSATPPTGTEKCGLEHMLRLSKQIQLENPCLFEQANSRWAAGASFASRSPSSRFRSGQRVYPRCTHASCNLSVDPQTCSLQPGATLSFMCRHVSAATKPPFAALWLQPYWLRSHRILSVKGPSQSHQATGLGVRKLFVIPELKASCSRDSCRLQ